jgi:hypothetical protein
MSSSSCFLIAMSCSPLGVTTLKAAWLRKGQYPPCVNLVAPMLTKTFRHPAVGEVTVDCDTLTLTDRDQHLVLFTAPPGSPGAEGLALLNVLGAQASNYVR